MSIAEPRPRRGSASLVQTGCIWCGPALLCLLFAGLIMAGLTGCGRDRHLRQHTKTNAELMKLWRGDRQGALHDAHLR